MSLEITGKLIQKLPIQSGVSKTGNNWQKMEFVIETMDQYPKKVCANLWGDRIDQVDKLNFNDTVKVSFDLESREFNGKWYTDVKAWKVELATATAPAGMPMDAPQMFGSASVAPAPAAPQATMNDLPPIEGTPEGTFVDNPGDDLPF